MPDLALDERGNPILFATIDIPVVSGNPSRETTSGRFGVRAKKQTKEQQALQVGISPEEAARRQDAVRDAAREHEIFSEQDVEEWLRGKTNRPLTSGEVANFLRDVRAQQLTDLADILDQQERGPKRTRRRVRVMASRGYTKRTMARLTDSELRELGSRLLARGWSTQQVRGLAKRVPERQRAAIESFSGESPELVLAPVPIDHPLERELVAEIVRGLPQPRIEVPVTVQQQRVKKIVHRDEDGLIASIDEVSIE